MKNRYDSNNNNKAKLNQNSLSQDLIMHQEDHDNSNP